MIETKQNSNFRRIYKGVNIRYMRKMWDEKNVGDSGENPDIKSIYHLSRSLRKLYELFSKGS